MKRTHTVENEVIWRQTTRHTPRANVRIPGIGYVTRREAQELARQVQVSQILGEDAAARMARLQNSLKSMRSVAANPLLAAV